MRLTGGTSPLWERDALARAALNLRSIPGTTRYRKFVIVATARTGSTLLVDLLKSHRQTRMFGELFRSPDAIGWDVKPFSGFQSPDLTSLYQRDPLAFLETHIFRRWPRSCKAVGFKLFYYHARTQPHSAVWDYLASRADIDVIHLRRRNLLAQYCSLRRAHETNVWAHSPDAQSDEAPLHLDPQTCVDHFAWVRGLEEECVRFFAGRNVHDVWYEDLIADQQRIMSDTQKFLGLESQSVKAKVTRQRTRPLRMTIENFDVLSRELAETRWSSFFEDETDSAHV